MSPERRLGVVAALDAVYAVPHGEICLGCTLDHDQELVDLVSTWAVANGLMVDRSYLDCFSGRIEATRVRRANGTTFALAYQRAALQTEAA